MKRLRFHISMAVTAFALAGAGTSAAQAQPIQQSPPSSSALDDKARDLFHEGVKAAEKSQWTKAHASFLAAWSLKQHYQILGNLGTSEAMLSKWRDAAEHLSRYLREAPKEKVEERKSAEALLAQARAKVGAIAVRVEPAGAEVFVDGKSAGKAPLDGEVFTEPGAHVIEAKLEGYEVATTTVDAIAGSAREVTLTLVKRIPQRGTGAATGAGAATGTSTVADTATVGGGGPTAQQDVGGPRKEIVIAGIATSASLISAGVVLAVVSSARGAKAAELREPFVREGSSDPCMAPTPPAQCEEFRSNLQARDTLGNLAIWSFIVGGTIGAATGVYALVAPKSKPAPPVRALPVAIAHGGGIAVLGEW